MSTRSTLTIKTDTTAINFYRHMDGYVAEAGQTLVQLMDKVNANNNDWVNAPPRFIKEIMKQEYKSATYPSIYELIDNPERHGDRQFHYAVTFGIVGHVKITVTEWKLNLDERSERKEVIFSGIYQEYKDFVAKEVEIMDQRRQAIDALHENKKNPIVIETNKSFRMRKGGV